MDPNPSSFNCCNHFVPQAISKFFSSIESVLHQFDRLDSCTLTDDNTNQHEQMFQRQCVLAFHDIVSLIGLLRLEFVDFMADAKLHHRCLRADDDSDLEPNGAGLSFSSSRGEGLGCSHEMARPGLCIPLSGDVSKIKTHRGVEDDDPFGGRLVSRDANLPLGRGLFLVSPSQPDSPRVGDFNEAPEESICPTFSQEPSLCPNASFFASSSATTPSSIDGSCDWVPRSFNSNFRPHLSTSEKYEPVKEDDAAEIVRVFHSVIPPVYIPRPLVGDVTDCLDSPLLPDAVPSRIVCIAGPLIRSASPEEFRANPPLTLRPPLQWQGSDVQGKGRPSLQIVLPALAPLLIEASTTGDQQVPLQIVMVSPLHSLSSCCFAQPEITSVAVIPLKGSSSVVVAAAVVPLLLPECVAVIPLKGSSSVVVAAAVVPLLLPELVAVIPLIGSSSVVVAAAAVPRLLPVTAAFSMSVSVKAIFSSFYRPNYVKRGAVIAAIFITPSEPLVLLHQSGSHHRRLLRQTDGRSNRCVTGDIVVTSLDGDGVGDEDDLSATKPATETVEWSKLSAQKSETSDCRQALELQF